MRRLTWLNLIMIFLFSCTSYANTAFVQNKQVQSFIKTMVKQYHFSEKELVATMNQVKLQPEIIEKMNAPYEKKTWDVYKELFITAKRVQGGIEFWHANKEALENAQKRYGVPAEIIVAIMGVETQYGERQGEYRVLDALSTLAFNYPRRSAFFTKELREYLLLCREHKVSPTLYMGSYAGAIGKPQFMPSSYRYYAVDFTNKGHRDLVNNNQDAIASVANYFHKHGWKPRQGIAQLAQVKGRQYKRLRVNPRTANYHYSQLESSGIKPITAAFNHPGRVGLIELNTAKGNEYWLAYPNFFVITRYNSSPQYALVVYLLAQHLKKQWAELNNAQLKAYV